MLSHIHLRNFAIVEELDLELKPGMTALTGETGAGKSILIDAIGLVLGDRADSGVVRHGAEKTEITLTVEIEDTPSAIEWLKQQDLNIEEEGNSDCILRRVITAQGKSRAWINGTPCNLNMLRQLGEQLVDIHGQHEHQSLMKKDMQREMLDDYIKNTGVLSASQKSGNSTSKLYPILDKTITAFKQWKTLQDKFQMLSNQNSDHQARLDLLRFQTQELDELQLEVDEANQLDEEYARLSHSGQLLESTSLSVMQLYDDDEQSLYSGISDVLHRLEQNAVLDVSLREPLEMLQNAQIQIQEASDFLRRYQDAVALDPERLEWVNNRLSTLHDLSRKHKTTPELLYQKWQQMLTQLEQLDSDEYDIESLQKKLETSKQDYLQAAGKLTKKRQRVATELSEKVSHAMQQLGMQGGKFFISIQPATNFSAQGMDDIEFLVSANPGQPLKPLIKVASGGELSRISLAIQMIAAQRMTLPALIFDEVDSGIGGGIAEIVGQELRNLGAKRQVLCVTHLPQVASQAHHHYKVTKIKGDDTTSTGMLILNEKQRIEEIARMIGGIEITESTLNLSREMLTRK